LHNFGQCHEIEFGNRATTLNLVTTSVENRIWKTKIQQFGNSKTLEVIENEDIE